MLRSFLPIKQSAHPHTPTHLRRRRHRSRVVATILVLMMLATLLPLGAAPAYAAPATKVNVGKATLNAATPYLVDGVAKADGDINDPNCTAHFDSTTATLTLSGLNLGAENSYESGDNRYGIYAFGDLTIELLGDNTMVVADSIGEASGSTGLWLAQGNLTVGGAGTLAVTSGAGFDAR